MGVCSTVGAAAIGWLVRSILGLFTDLSSWSAQVRLDEDINNLVSEMKRVDGMVLEIAKGKRIDSELLAGSLSNLKDLLYEAEDVLDELDYYRLQDQVIRGNSGDVTATAALGPSEDTAPSSSVSFSQIGSYAVRCSSNILFKASDITIQKMKRQKTHTTRAGTLLDNKGRFSAMINQVAGKLREARTSVIEDLETVGLIVAATSDWSHHSTPPATNAATSSYLLEPKVYGRDAEMESIKKLIMTNKSNDITVLPIVGNGGIGKTTLPQRVYNDPEIENQFGLKIWVHIGVSDKFDVDKTTREILECVTRKSQQKGNFNMLQEDLQEKKKSKRLLIVLDDIWDVTTEDCWSKLLAPLRSNHVNQSQEQVTGNTIIITTRIQTVADMCGTAGSINLEALEDGDTSQLFKAYAFGNNNPASYPILHDLGEKIVRKLNGNPLAIKTVGRLLSRNLTTDHWNGVIENEEWKSLQNIGGVMHALRLSYDHLPNHLQQCVSYCSLFPKGYYFREAQLIQIWIAQGFVEKSSERLERKGWKYLAELVNSGFLQQVESMWSSSEYFVMHDLMHDLAKLVAQTECATIDGSECKELEPSIRHLSILTDSAYHEDNYGNISRNEEFEKRLLEVTSRSKLRTLILIGEYDHHFFKSFQDAFKKVQHLRLLHITSTFADFDSFLSSLVSYTHVTHLRYLRVEDEESQGALPQAMSECYHLQVLDVGTLDIPNGTINNLVSLQHLVAQKGVWSSIANIGEMTSLQELTNFKVENSIGFEITQLQRMSELVELGVSQLENVRTKQEASGASLKDKHHLERLHLFWKGVPNGYDSDSSSENECDGDMIPEPSMQSETEGERLQMTDSTGVPSLDHIPDIASEVLEGLKPHHNLKYLRISWYNGAKAPTWLSTSLTYLKTLRLENCGEWQRLSLERLSLLRKLVLIEMKNASELSISSPEEIILIGMQKLHTCSCTSMGHLNSSLRILKIIRCPVLKVFPLFEKYHDLGYSWSMLPHLSKLTIHDCHDLSVPHPFPPSTIISELSIKGVSTLPTMISDGGKLTIGSCSDKQTAMDKTMLLYHNLRFVTTLQISHCQNLRYISLEGLRQLIHLKSLYIDNCQNLFSSDVPQEPTSTREDMVAGNRNDSPSLEELKIENCGITGKWLSQMLQHVQGVQKLTLQNCPAVRRLSIGEEENCQVELLSDLEASSSRYPDASISSTGDGLLRIPLNLVSSLKEIDWARENSTNITSKKKLTNECLSLMQNGNDGQANENDYSLETTLPCFLGKPIRLIKIIVKENPSLKFLRLQSCTTLEYLRIEGCASLAIEGWQFPRALRQLAVYRCPSLPLCLGSLSGQGYDLCRLEIDDPSILTTSFCKHLTSLQRLELSSCESEVARLTDEQERALQLLLSLQELRFEFCNNLVDLPTGLHSLPSLKRLEIWSCWSIARLPEMGLPPSLEELYIDFCREELAQQCRFLASKLKFKINGRYVNDYLVAC